MVTEKASTASKTATERFDKIEKMVKQQRERILNDIDHRLWMQLDPLEAKKSRLEYLLQRQAAFVEVGIRFSVFVQWFFLKSVASVGRYPRKCSHHS